MNNPFAIGQQAVDPHTGCPMILRSIVLTASIFMSVTFRPACLANPMLPLLPPPEWDVLGGGFPGADLREIKFDSLDRLLVAGYTSSSITLPRWNGAGWDDIADPAWTQVHAIEFDSAYVLYASWGIYDFNTYAWTYGVSYHDGVNWHLIGNPSGMVRDMVFDPAGNLYITGDFVSIDGIVCNGIARWDGSDWTSLGAGLFNNYYGNLWLSGGNDMIILPDSSLVVVGAFNTVDGQAMLRIARYKEAENWSTFAGGIDIGSVNAVEVDAAGTLYVGGDGNYPAYLASVMKWDGTSWQPLGDWGTNGYVQDLEFDTAGNLYAAGGFELAGGVVSGMIAAWNGTNWLNPGAGVFDNPSAYSIRSNGNGQFAVCGGFYSAVLNLNKIGIFTPDDMINETPVRFRTKASGAWTSAATWEVYDGSDWVDATKYPSSSADTIRVRAGHMIEAPNSLIDANQLYVSGTLFNARLSVVNGPGYDIVIEPGGSLESDQYATWYIGVGVEIVTSGTFFTGATLNNVNLTINAPGELVVGPSGNCPNYWGYSCPCSGRLEFSGTITNHGTITVVSGGIFGVYNAVNRIVNHGLIIYGNPPPPPGGACPECCPAYANPEWRRAILDNYGTFRMAGNYDLDMLEGAKLNNKPGGVVEVDYGSLTVDSGGDSTGGEFIVDAGRTLCFRFGTHHFTHETWLSGEGNVCFQANTLGSCLPVFDSLIHVQVPHVLISNCCQFYGTSISGKGEFRVYDGTVVDYIGGGWTDSTLIHVMAGATWNFAPEPFFAMGPPGFNPGLVLENYGTINNTDIKVPGNFQLNNHGTIHLSSHYFGNTTAQPHIASSFMNAGELHVSGGGEFPLLGPLFQQTADGAIFVDSSTYLTRIGASVWDGGNAVIDSAGFILLLAGTHSFAGSDSITGGGVLRMENSFYGGSFPSIAGDPYINCGEIQSAAGMVVDGRLKIGPECAAYFTLHPVTGFGTIENHGVLGGTTSIVPDSILNLGTISPGVSSFGTLILTSDVVNEGSLLLEVNGAQHDLIVFPGSVGPLGGALHVQEKPWPRFPVGDTVNILSTPAGGTLVFDTLIGCFDTLVSPAVLRVHKLFEDAVACAQPYDTIRISPSLDTIELSGPLDITVPMTWLDDAGQRVVLRVDFAAPGFIGALYGIKVTSMDPFHVNAFHLYQPGMDPAPPMILNEGDLHLFDTRITGPGLPYVNNAPGSFLTVLGEVFIGMDE